MNHFAHWFSNYNPRNPADSLVCRYRAAIGDDGDDDSKIPLAFFFTVLAFVSTLQGQQWAYDLMNWIRALIYSLLPWLFKRKRKVPTKCSWSCLKNELSLCTGLFNITPEKVIKSQELNQPFVFRFTFILYMWVFCLHICVCVPPEVREGVESSVTGVEMDDCEPPPGC